MFCSRCGKQIEDGSKFCQYCGSAQEIKEYDSSEKVTHSPVLVKEKRGIVFGMSVVDLIIAGLYVVAVFLWGNIFFKNLKGTWQTFSFIDTDTKFLGIVLFIIPCIFILSLCIIGILGIKNKHYHMSIGIIIAVVALLMKIGTYFFDEMAIQSFKVIFYRIFQTYGKIGMSSIVIGVLLSVLTYAKVSNKK